MQNRYVGDVGDFAKFWIFRELFYTQKLAQIWFLHEFIENNNDGSITDYFSRFKGVDNFLEEALKGIEKDVRALERANILPNARFFYETICKNQNKRKEFIDKAITFARDSKVVALAPDNGIAIKCSRKEKSIALIDSSLKKDNSHKFVFSDEIEKFFTIDTLEVLVLYQHLNRCFSHNLQVELILRELRVSYPHSFAIKFKPYSLRIFIILCKKETILKKLKIKVKNFCNNYTHVWEFYD